jgi:hypothetical protein
MALKPIEFRGETISIAPNIITADWLLNYFEDSYSPMIPEGADEASRFVTDTVQRASRPEEETMSHNRAYSKYVVLSGAGLIFLVVLMVTLCEKSSSGSAAQPKGPSERIGTYAFDNCRFFCSHTSDGVDVGNRGWFNITVKGRRDYIAGIDAARSALVVVDMQRGSLGWSKLPGELGRSHAERTRDVVIPNLVRLIKRG